MEPCRTLTRGADEVGEADTTTLPGMTTLISRPLLLLLTRDGGRKNRTGTGIEEIFHRGIGIEAAEAEPIRTGTVRAVAGTIAIAIEVKFVCDYSRSTSSAARKLL